MADEVNWGRVREWDGSKGCPPVAVGKLCAVFVTDVDGEKLWGNLANPKEGQFWPWGVDDTAYRLRAEFDHLDDNGNPADPFAGHTSAELRAAADAKDAADDTLKPWEDLFDAAYYAFASTSSKDGEDNKAAARILRDGAIELLGVTL